MQRQTMWTRIADGVIEAGWLLALLFTPFYFSLLTARHFEPDKAMVLRSIVLVMLAAWAIKSIERAVASAPWTKERPNWRALWRAPLALPALMYGGVFVLATLTSVQPTTSWWGSYQRGQGTYTNLSYIALFALIVGNLRSREQLGRLITTAIVTGVAVSLYGLIQHAGLDPLPWKGDVLTRISSTMGNSIFVAAYLIMIVPLVLYRLTLAVAQLRHAPPGNGAIDWTWAGFFALLIAGQQALLLGILKMMVAVRPDGGGFRYWWILPSALALAALTWTLLQRRTTTERRTQLTSWALGGWGAWSCVLLLVYSFGSSTQTLDSEPVRADWWAWLLLGLTFTAIFLFASFFLPRRADETTRPFALAQVIGYGAALVVMLLAIFYSQSRGPWIGGMAGVGLFVVLLLARLIWTGQAQGWAALPRLRVALWSVLGVGVLIGGLLIAFNTSQAPVFEQLRQVPYLGRLGRLLETDEGTGRVRTLIWFGDDRGGGTLGLLRSDWLRTLTLGHGPETMFTVYNPFYPPELARYEARGASPDRSHQAWLDELVTKGALGLLSYFFLFGSAIVLAVRQLRRSDQFEHQLIALAALAAIVAHAVEVLVGIPIVSTLTMLWVTFAVLSVNGLLQGFGVVDQTNVALATDQIESAHAVDAPKRSKGRGQPAKGRASAGRAVAGAPVATAGSAWRWAYPMVLAGALLLGWDWNLTNSYADMYLNRGQSFTTSSVTEEAYAYQQFVRAVEIEPDEDYYYLQLGNSLLKLIYPYKLASQQTFDASTAPRANQQLADLFATRPEAERLRDQRGQPLDAATDRAYRLIQSNSTEQLMEYTRLVLERAADLNPGNKDHPANLGRLFSLWARRANGGAEKYQQSIAAFERARQIAPNDAAILNELASTLALAGNPAAAEQRFKESIALDPRYPETYARLGELYRANGRLPEAAQQYAEAVSRNRNVLEDGRSLDPILQSLKADPQAIKALRAAFEAQKQTYDQRVQAAQANDPGGTAPTDARFISQLGRVRAADGDLQATRAAFDNLIQLAPDNVTYRQQYSMVLSDTQQFDAALQQAQQALQMAQQQQLDRQVADIQKLIDAMRAKAGG